MATADVPANASADDLIEGFNNLNLVRQAGLMVGLAASVAFGIYIAFWSLGEDYKPLYGSLDRLDSSEVGEVLDFNDIPYKIDPSTSALLVPADKLQKARMKLAEAGIQGDRSFGLEMLEQEQPLGTSQFIESMRYRRGLEGELARTIASINAVRGARVHLAIPKRSVFIRDARDPSASVFLDLFPGRPIKQKQVQGIANLVASSIPELKIQNVTVVDQKGNLLSVGEEDAQLKMAAQHLEYARKVEDDIVLRVRRLLMPIIGDGNFKTEVAADIDFTEMEQAEESYNPDLPAVRSERKVDEQQTGAGAGGAIGIPGALTNQPPADGQAPEVAGGGAEGADGEVPTKRRSQSTTNYELDRTVSYKRFEKGRLRRLTVAVVVDDKEVPGSADEKRPWTEAELERLSILIRDAVGYSAARGDSVNVLNEQFRPLPKIEALEEDLAFWQTETFQQAMKPAAGALVIIALLIGLVRPVLKTLAGSGVKSKEIQEQKELEALQAAGIDSFDSLSDETVTLTGGDALGLPSPEESYEQQLNTVKGLVAEDAGRVAQVIKRWINED